MRNSCIQQQFQSTCPLRGTTLCASDGQNRRSISIHVPLAGHDAFCVVLLNIICNFNPRAPCGARPKTHSRRFSATAFQSTCPLRGTTIARTSSSGTIQLQSTCPLRGTTVSGAFRIVTTSDFNPRAPCGARPTTAPRMPATSSFQSTCPLRGTTCVAARIAFACSNFNPRAPCGARR